MGKQFTSEYQPDNRGRKKSILTVLGELTGDRFQIELSRTDKMRILECMIEKSQDELKEISEDKQMPIFTRLVAKRVHDDLELGLISSLETLLDRVYGRPAQNKIIEHKGKITHVMGSLEATISLLARRDGNGGSTGDRSGSIDAGHSSGGLVLAAPVHTS